MIEVLTVAVSDLVVDTENPRLPEPNKGQRDAQQTLANNQQAKLVALAKDIIAHGLNPSELPIAMRMDDNQYVFLEGNRRLTALRALENPDLLRDAVSASVLKQFRTLSKEYEANPIESVMCLVVDDREEARHWIELRHTGENKGAGIVGWGSSESSRFRSRHGRKAEIYTQALDFLEEQGAVGAEQRRKVPVTSLRRLLGTPAVRARLGVDVDDGTLMLAADPKRVARALKHVVDDLTEQRINTAAIYTQELRKKYADSLPRGIAVKATLPPDKRIPATAAEKAAVKPAGARRTTARPRDKLIPRDCTLHISVGRIKQMESELRRLSLQNHTNAVSVLLRVFLELSADHYIHRFKLTGVNENSRLREKFRVVVRDLQARKKLTPQQAKPVNRACQKDSFLAPSIDLMHQYVHNQHVFPVGGDLRAHWDNLQPFVMAIWAP